MIVLDVNILVAAHLAEHPHHAIARPWLQRALAGAQTVTIPDTVWVGFVRVVTNSRVFDVPSTMEAATAFAHAVVSAPGYRGLAGHIDGIEPFLEMCIESDSAGNLVPDAYIASVARAYGAPVASFDRDFRRFDGLEIVVPA